MEKIKAEDEKGLKALAEKVVAFYGMPVEVRHIDINEVALVIWSPNKKRLFEVGAHYRQGVWKIGTISHVTSEYSGDLFDL